MARTITLVGLLSGVGALAATPAAIARTTAPVSKAHPGKQVRLADPLAVIEGKATAQGAIPGLVAAVLHPKRAVARPAARARSGRKGKVAAQARIAGPLIVPKPGTAVKVGTQPSGVAVSNTRAYVANSQSNSVSVIDTTATPPDVVATVPVGAVPIGVALSPDGTAVYVTNFESGTLSIISTATNTVLHTVTVGSRPDGVVQVGASVYVANLLGASISVVNPIAGTVTNTIPLQNDAAPSGLAGSSDGTKLYADDARNNQTLEIDLAGSSPSFTGGVTVGAYPAYISTTPFTGYVANADGGSVSLLDLSASPPTVEQTISVGTGSEPYGVVAVPSLSEAFVSDSGTNQVSVIDTFADPPDVVGTFPVGTTPDAIAVSPDTTTAVVANEGDGTATVLHVNQAPGISVPAVQTAQANGPSGHNDLVLSGADGNAVSVSDVDGGSGTEQINLSPLDGTVDLTDTSGLSLTAGTNGSASVTYQGTLAAINADLAAGVDYTPNEGFHGSDSIVVTIDDLGNSGVGKAQTTTDTVPVDVVNTAPTVGAVTFSGAVGNTTFGVGTSPPQPSTADNGSGDSVLANASDINGDTLTAVPGTITTTKGGSVVLSSNGTFTYSPPAGFTGNDTFSFSVSDGTTTTTGTATIKVAGLVWYVNDAGTTDGSGTSSAPFNRLMLLSGKTTAGDTIFLFTSTATYGGGLTLNQNETLVGQSFGLTVGGQTLVSASGANPTVTNAAGAGLTLQGGDAVDGITISGSSGANVTGAGAFTLDSSDKIENGLGDGLDVTGGSGAVTDGATISGNAGHSVSVQSITGGTVTISGPVTDDGGGVLLQNNTGGEVDFTGGLTASTGAKAAFTATGGGTVTVTGSGNTLATTTGIALDVANTNIGSNGLTFGSISAGNANAGPTQGVILDDTSSGALSVGGGTIENTTSTASDANGNRAAAAELINTGPVVLEDMTFTNDAGGGVWSNDTSSLTVSGGSFTDNGLEGVHVGGSGTFSGTFDVLGNTFSENSTAAGSDIAVLLLGTAATPGSGTVSGHIKNNTIGSAGTAKSGAFGGGEAIDVDNEGDWTLEADVSDNTISQVAQSYGIDAEAAAGTLAFSPILDLTLNANAINMDSTDSLDAITVASGTNNSKVCLNATANSSHAAGTAAVNGQFDADGMSVIQNEPSSTFQIQGYTGPSSDSGGQVESLLDTSPQSLSGPGGPSIAVIQNGNTTGFTPAPMAGCPTAP